jgi:hypothetical protein
MTVNKHDPKLTRAMVRTPAGLSEDERSHPIREPRIEEKRSLKIKDRFVDVRGEMSKR